HLLLTDPPVLSDLVRRLAGLPVLLVTLKPPFEVLERRIAERTFDKKVPTELLGSDAVRKMNDRLNRLRPWFYEEVYRNPVTDLEIDTSRHDPAQVVAMIAERLAQGPGDAFPRLLAQLNAQQAGA
ncbi:MAG TPA: chloramphenicol phosphotransferase, partial [Novosphingobium sp.]|nr:chloramphenicol phosphotransferase [Novosphingobium sp.]